MNMPARVKYNYYLNLLHQYSRQFDYKEFPNMIDLVVNDFIVNQFPSWKPLKGCHVYFVKRPDGGVLVCLDKSKATYYANHPEEIEIEEAPPKPPPHRPPPPPAKKCPTIFPQTKTDSIDVPGNFDYYVYMLKEGKLGKITYSLEGRLLDITIDDNMVSQYPAWKPLKGCHMYFAKRPDGGIKAFLDKTKAQRYLGMQVLCIHEGDTGCPPCRTIMFQGVPPSPYMMINRPYDSTVRSLESKSNIFVDFVWEKMGNNMFKFFVNDFVVTYMPGEFEAMQASQYKGCWIYVVKRPDGGMIAFLNEDYARKYAETGNLDFLCKEGEIWNPTTGQCEPAPFVPEVPEVTEVPEVPEVPTGITEVPTGIGFPEEEGVVTCPEGQVWNPVTKSCEPITVPKCPEGLVPCPIDGNCIPEPLMFLLRPLTLPIELAQSVGMAPKPLIKGGPPLPMGMMPPLPGMGPPPAFGGGQKKTELHEAPVF